MLTDEAAIVSARVSEETAGKALLMQSALATVPNMGIKPSSAEKAQMGFRKLIETLTGGRGG